MAIYVTVTDVSITAGDMLVSLSTTNTLHAGVTRLFSTKHGASQTLEGVVSEINSATLMMWAGYGNPSWTVPEV